jgi:hypothetical protein
MSTPNTKTCAAKVTVTKEKGDLVFCMSTANVDRDGDKIEQNWVMRGKVPLLAFHDWDMPPVGTIDKVVTKGDRTYFTPKWVPDNIYPFAGKIRALYELGYMSAVSPGFMPIETKAASPEERKAAGIGPGGMWVTKSELHEVSVVNVPANAEALVQSAGKGLRPVHVGSGGEKSPKLRELVTKGLKRDAVAQWLKEAKMTEEEKPVEEEVPPVAEDTKPEEEVEESKAPDLAAVGEHAKAIVDILLAPEGVTPESLGAALEHAQALAGMGAPAEAEAAPDPAPEAAQLNELTRQLGRLVGLLEKAHDANTDEDEADGVADYLSDAERLATLAASVNGAGKEG